MTTAWHKKYGTVIVHSQSSFLTQIETPKDIFWVPNGDLLPEEPLNGSQQREAAVRAILAARVWPDPFIQYLLDHFSEVEVSFRYPVHLQDVIDRVLVAINAPAGLEYRPNRFGKFGGIHERRGIDFLMVFPRPDSIDIIPRDILSSYHVYDDRPKVGMIYNTLYVQELVRLHGFRLINSKRDFGKDDV